MADPNNYYLPEHRLVFQMICKAANTSMKWMLIDHFVEPHRKRAVAKNPSLQWKMIHKYDIPEDCLVIGFCRHPEDRLVSCWKDKINGKRFHSGFERRHPGVFYHHMPFSEFVTQVSKIVDAEGAWCDQHFRSQTFDLNLAQVDYLVRVENIAEDWEQARFAIYNHCGLDLPPIYHKNQTVPQIVKMSSATRSLIEKRYEQDYVLLNYESRNCSNS